MRTETRAERYQGKAKEAISLPFSFCATNFSFDGNMAYLARALACFGGQDLHVIGKKIADNELNRLSGGHSKLINFIYHSNPIDFLDWVRGKNEKGQNIRICCAEIAENARNIHEYSFDFTGHCIIVVGNEMSGIPVELTKAGDLVYIPMTGKGFCLNTSQTANVFAYEYHRQFMAKYEKD